MNQNERGLSEIVGLMLMAFLIIVTALLIIGLLTGVITDMLQKPALISVKAVQFDTLADEHIIGLSHMEGDHVILAGTTQNKAASIISIALVDTSGTRIPVRSASTSMGEFWGPGTRLYIYPNGSGGYVFSDIAPTTAGFGMSPGSYKVLITDDKAKVLLHSLPVTISS